MLQTSCRRGRRSSYYFDDETDDDDDSSSFPQEQPEPSSSQDPENENDDSLLLYDHLPIQCTLWTVPSTTTNNENMIPQVSSLHVTRPQCHQEFSYVMDTTDSSKYSMGLSDCMFLTPKDEQDNNVIPLLLYPNPSTFWLDATQPFVELETVFDVLFLLEEEEDDDDSLQVAPLHDNDNTEPDDDDTLEVTTTTATDECLLETKTESSSSSSDPLSLAFLQQQEKETASKHWMIPPEDESAVLLLNNNSTKFQFEFPALQKSSPSSSVPQHQQDVNHRHQLHAMIQHEQAQVESMLTVLAAVSGILGLVLVAVLAEPYYYKINQKKHSSSAICTTTPAAATTTTSSNHNAFTTLENDHDHHRATNTTSSTPALIHTDGSSAATPPRTSFSSAPPPPKVLFPTTSTRSNHHNKDHKDLPKGEQVQVNDTTSTSKTTSSYHPSPSSSPNQNHLDSIHAETQRVQQRLWQLRSPTSPTCTSSTPEQDNTILKPRDLNPVFAASATTSTATNDDDTTTSLVCLLSTHRNKAVYYLQEQSQHQHETTNLDPTWIQSLEAILQRQLVPGRHSSNVLLEEERDAPWRRGTQHSAPFHMTVKTLDPQRIQSMERLLLVSSQPRNGNGNGTIQPNPETQKSTDSLLLKKSIEPSSSFAPSPRKASQLRFQQRQQQQMGKHADKLLPATISTTKKLNPAFLQSMEQIFGGGSNNNSHSITTKKKHPRSNHKKQNIPWNNNHTESSSLLSSRQRSSTSKTVSSNYENDSSQGKVAPRRRLDPKLVSSIESSLVLVPSTKNVLPSETESSAVVGQFAPEEPTAQSKKKNHQHLDPTFVSRLERLFAGSAAPGRQQPQQPPSLQLPKAKKLISAEKEVVPKQNHHRHQAVAIVTDDSSISNSNKSKASWLQLDPAFVNHLEKMFAGRAKSSSASLPSLQQTPKESSSSSSSSLNAVVVPSSSSSSAAAVVVKPKSSSALQLDLAFVRNLEQLFAGRAPPPPTSKKGWKDDDDVVKDDSSRKTTTKVVAPQALLPSASISNDDASINKKNRASMLEKSHASPLQDPAFLKSLENMFAGRAKTQTRSPKSCRPKSKSSSFATPNESSSQRTTLKTDPKFLASLEQLFGGRTTTTSSSSNSHKKQQNQRHLEATSTTKTSVGSQQRTTPATVEAIPQETKQVRSSSSSLKTDPRFIASLENLFVGRIAASSASPASGHGDK